MKVDGVLLAVPPNVIDEVVWLGIPRVLMHKGAGAGTVPESAIQFRKENNIATVYGVCPFIYLQPQRFDHKLHYTFAKGFGELPKDA